MLVMGRHKDFYRRKQIARTHLMSEQFLTCLYAYFLSLTTTKPDLGIPGYRYLK